MNIKEVLLSKFTASLFITGFQGLANVGYPLILGLLIEPRDFLLFSLLVSYTLFSSLLIDQGLGSAILRFEAFEKKEGENKIISSFVIFYFIFLILGFIIGSILSVTSISESSNRVLFIILLLTNFTVHSAHIALRKYQQGNDRFYKLAIMEGLGIVVLIVSFKLLNQGSTDLYSIVIPLVLYHLTIPIVFAISNFRNRITSFSVDKNMMNRVLKFGLNSSLGSLLFLGLNHLQLYFSTWYTSENASASLAFWNYFAFLGSFLSLAAAPYLTSKFGKMGKNYKEDRVRQEIAKVDKRFSPIIYIINFGIFAILLLSNSFLSRFYPDTYSLEIYQNLVYILLFNVSINFTIILMVIQFTINDEDAKYFPRLSLLAGIVVLIIWLVFTPAIGILAIPLGLTGGYMIQILSFNYLLWKLYNRIHPISMILLLVGCVGYFINLLV